MVALAYVLHTFFDYSNSFNSCAVGFSAVLFSLKYVWNQKADSNTHVFGISVPTKYAAWAELVMISVVTPNASFVGHLAGILAGMLYIHVPKIASLRGFINSSGDGSGYDGSTWSTNAPPSYTYASGFASASRSTATASASANVSPSRRNAGNPDYRPTGRTATSSSSSAPSSSSSSSSYYPFPSAPPLPREYQAGDVLDVVYIDDIDEGIEVEDEIEVVERVDVGREKIPGRSGNVNEERAGVGSNVIDLAQSTATIAIDSNEVRRRRLERFNRT